MWLSCHDHTPSIAENILVPANIVPCHLADVFYQPQSTNQVKKKIPRLVKKGRVFTGTEHCDKVQ